MATKSESMKERDIWNSFLNGNDQSLVFIYEEYFNMLYNYGCQFGCRPELVRDCIQDIFCHLIDKRHNLSSVNSIKAYLLVCLKRRILKRIKKEESIKMQQEGFRISLTERTFSMYHNFDNKEYSIIQKKINELPVNQREVILLYFFEGLTYSEIAEIMGIKIRSARALTYRALDSLEKQLKPIKAELYQAVMHAFLLLMIGF